ncbi:RIO1 family regulatory kinase/ATPase [Marinomonas sp. TI.3.20]|uniref:RIO1 family regulatory kinase/ATPase domain-containing protein n=1 Tax=Marinomonas sp. TI.3.20 TaxID=3121296 RepID=UPI00311DF44F
MNEQKLISQLAERFPQRDFHVDNLSVLHKGRFANAIVYRYKDDHFDFVIKDFQHSPWFVRKTLARLFINQEYKALKRLNGMDGVSDEYHRLSSIGIAYAFIEGVPLRTLSKQGEKIPKAFFNQLEHMVSEMHRRGLVHLDLRNLGNVILGKDGKPYFIDFQSAMTFDRFPVWLQRYMRGADLSGVYKGWSAVCELPVTGYKKIFFTNFNQFRKRWIFRGYPIHRASLWLIGLASQLPGAGLLRSITDRF